MSEEYLHRPPYNEGMPPPERLDDDAERPAGTMSLLQGQGGSFRPFDARPGGDAGRLSINSLDSGGFEVALLACPPSVQDGVAAMTDELRGLRDRVEDLQRRQDEELLAELRRTAGPHVRAAEALLRERRRGRRRAAGFV